MIIFLRYLGLFKSLIFVIFYFPCIVPYTLDSFIQGFSLKGGSISTSGSSLSPPGLFPPNSLPTFMATLQPTQEALELIRPIVTLACLSARYIEARFRVPRFPLPAEVPKLSFFISYAIPRTRYHSAVIYDALFLLERLSGLPHRQYDSGHELFLTALIIVSKYGLEVEDTFKSRDWYRMSRGLFNVRQINRMEWEMCEALKWNFRMDPRLRQQFKDRIKVDFSETAAQPYPVYPVSMVNTVRPERNETPLPAHLKATPLPYS